VSYYKDLKVGTKIEGYFGILKFPERSSEVKGSNFRFEFT
jgi:hypothetical protein